MMRGVALCAALAVCAAPASAGWLTTWQTYGGHQYRLTDDLTWANAEAQAVSAGGYLVTLNDAAEDTWVYNTFAATASSAVTDPIFGYWIGLYQPTGSAEPAGGWSWISGQPVTYVNWRSPAEPNNSNANGAEQVAQVIGPNAATPNVPRKWNDNWEANAAPAVVEIVPEPGSALLVVLAAVVLLRRASVRCL